MPPDSPIARGCMSSIITPTFHDLPTPTLTMSRWRYWFPPTHILIESHSVQDMISLHSAEVRHQIQFCLLCVLISCQWTTCILCRISESCMYALSAVVANQPFQSMSLINRFRVSHPPVAKEVPLDMLREGYTGKVIIYDSKDLLIWQTCMHYVHHESGFTCL